MIKTDIIFPNNNEPEFIHIAKQLGCTKLFAIYPPDKIPPKSSTFLTPITLLDEKAPQFSKLCRKINLPLLLRARSDPRTLIEQYKPSFITGLESIFTKDRTHQRSSGLNHIICKAANKFNTTLVLDLGSVFFASPPKIPILLGRIRQNKMLCEKYKAKYILATFAQNPFQMKPPHDLRSFLNVL